MKKTDLAYCAGLFDGEGCIHISKQYLKKQPPAYYNLRVTITNTNQYVLEWFHFSFSGNLYLQKPKENRQRAWRWQIADRQAEEFLRAILPYLIIKKAEAELALKFMAGKGIKGTREIRAERKVLQEAQRVLMKKLKEPVI